MSREGYHPVCPGENRKYRGRIGDSFHVALLFIFMINFIHDGIAGQLTKSKQMTGFALPVSACFF